LRKADGVKKRKEKGYTISAVSEAYGIHPQTLRLYERHGLLKPSRSKGNTRYYSEQDLQRLEFILTLTRELGVNLAGVEIILNMRDKMDAMQREIQRFLEFLRMELGERLVSQVTEKFALVPFSYGALLRASSAEAEDERDVPFTYIEETSWESTDHG
jgi:MerR family transcriptional regulator/heat shock protein HspR